MTGSATSVGDIPPPTALAQSALVPPKTVPRPWWALVVCVGAVASLVIGSWLYTAHVPPLNIVEVELGGRGQDWPLPAGTSTAIAWDYAYIAGYGLALWLGTTAARWVFWTERAASLARLGRGAAVLVVVADLIENLCLTVALNNVGPRPSGLASTALDAAAIAATIKCIVLVPTGILAIVGILVTLGRLLVSRRRHEPWPDGKVFLPTATEEHPSSPLTDGAPKGSRRARARRDVDGIRTALHERLYRTIPQNDPMSDAFDRPPDEPRWRHAFTIPGISAQELAERTSRADITGFCLSGGGIRSGSVAMGALQTLRTELRSARYLVSISGGGFTSGALAQLLTDAGDENVAAPGHAVHDPSQGFGPGSVELDRVRRHSSYLATTAAQMLVALAVLARGFFATLVLLFGPAIALGVAAAWFYHSIAIAVLPVLPRVTTTSNAVGVTTTNAVGATTSAPLSASLDLPLHAVLAVAVVAGLAVLAWLLQIAAANVLTSPGQALFRWAGRSSVFLTRIAVITTIGAIGVPMLVWASGRIVSFFGADIKVGIGGSVGAVLLTYVAGIASIGWRKRKTIQRVAGAAVGRKGGARAAVPTGLLQLLLVILSVGVLWVSWLLFLGIAAVGTATDLAEGNPSPWIRVAIGALLMAVLLGGLFDESSLSLHPFYRRRLASAFATRAVSVPGPHGPTLVAAAYHSREQTTLSRYARPAKSAEPFPEFIFAAAANLTGENRTPPGLNAVSFTMSADWVGGPDVGWVDTATLEGLCPPRLRRDVTVQAAVAISGAAFASAMGRFGRWYQIILAVSGARLGSWLPNPTFLSAMRSARDKDGRVIDWTLPCLPRIRRATYLLRELFNIHPREERLLQVTDGGHYENLGIVELLRRRCTTIYCIDGGGYRPPTAPGLAQAMALAEAELGVRIELTDAFASEPGAGVALTPKVPLATLNAMLSKEPVIVGTIHYPAASGLPEGSRTGVLYVARALLWPEMPYSLLSYAAQNPVFPHDATSDQWFNDGQFTAYTQLGRELGEVVKKVRARGVATEVNTEATTEVNAEVNASHNGDRERTDVTEGQRDR
jgi:hypothetical protein